MNRQRHTITETVLIDYLEGTLAVERQREVRDWLMRDSALRQTFESLQKQERELHALGKELREVAPHIHIADSVMRAIERTESSIESIESELNKVGELLRQHAPSIDFTGAIMAMLPEEDSREGRAPLEKNLVEIGKSLRARTPQVDLVPPVMEEVEKESAGKVVSFDEQVRLRKTQNREHPVSWALFGSVAAVLLLGLGFLLAQMMEPVKVDRVSIARSDESARTDVGAGGATVPAPEREGEPLPFKNVISDGPVSLMSAFTRPVSTEQASSDEEEDGVVTAGFTIEDVLQARRASLEGNAESLAMLARWGALDPDEVRRLYAEGALTSAQLAGMSRFLPAAESMALLRDAIQQSPTDPALRLALAKQLMENPGGYDEAFQQLAALRTLAPENALVHYMEAQLLFAMGDFSNGLSMLEYAAEFGTAQAYAMANAQSHSAALQAAGIAPEMADMLAAFYAGTDEHSSVSQLRGELIGYGAYFESIGDYDTAMAIYKSIGLLGTQLAAGASYTNEYLAGLDTQAASLEAMNALASLINIPGGLQTIQTAYDIFVNGMNVFMEYTSILDGVTSISDVTAVLNAVNVILQTGDINYIQSLLN